MVNPSLPVSFLVVAYQQIWGLVQTPGVPHPLLMGQSCNFSMPPFPYQHIMGLITLLFTS